jgi:hypothetical protein
MKRILSLFILLTSYFYASSQDTASCRFRHYAGVQVNQLIKQLVNLSNTNTAINNPYLLTYSVSDSRTKFGIHTGFGYNYLHLHDKNLPAPLLTKSSDINWRVGIDRRMNIGRKFEAMVGVDYVNEYSTNRTFSSSVVIFSSNLISDSSISFSYARKVVTGGGLNLALSFKISERILLGTEATYYFTQTTTKQNIQTEETIISSSTTDVIYDNNNSETEMQEFNITFPVALFLFIKF